MLELGWIYGLLLAPLCVSLGCFATLKAENRKICTALHITGLALMFIFALKVIADVLTYGALTALGQWIYIDSLAAIFIGLIGIVGVLAGIYSIGYINTEAARGHIDTKGYTLYYGFLHLFFFTMLVSVTTNNLILMWVGIEATTLSSAFLVGTYKQRTSLEAAWKYIIICSVGVAFGLYGTILTFSDANSLLSDPTQAIFWSAINQQAGGLNATLMHLAFVFILIGFGTKCGLFPMHTWLPDAHSEAPSPVSAILSAVLLNCAMLVVLRYYILVSKAVGPAYPQTLLLVFGLLSVAVAALFIIIQSDIKRLLAYSSVENMGLISFAFGLGGPLGMFAGLLHTINHSLAKTLLFCVSGNILLKYNTRDMNRISGLWRVAPVSAVLFAAGALALGGIPPFNVFVSEFSIVAAGIYAEKGWLVVLCLILLTIVLAGLAMMVLKIVLGKRPEQIEAGETDSMSLIVMAILLLLMLGMGLYIAEPVLQLLTNAAGILLGQENIAFGEMLALPWQSLGK
ncbi:MULTISPECIES: hydrogenase 4 subunit F [Pasteurellaceae]|uniref:hydrogenase 4 subunit F n=1 Tax=Pasteurellaceae TaxID=712 RepID=UPI003566A27D